MKKNNHIVSIIIVCICIVLLNAACKKEPLRLNETFSIAVDNVPADIKSVSTKIRQGSGNRNYLQIIATLVNGDQAFVEIFYNDIGEKAVMNVSNDYKGDFGYLAQAANNNSWYEASVNYPGGSGSIVIAKNDLVTKTIEGTFSGIAVNAYNPQDKKAIVGSFIVRYDK